MSVDNLNEYMMSLFLGEEKIYKSTNNTYTTNTNFDKFDDVHILEFLNTINISSIPNHQLNLKIHMSVMLLRKLINLLKCVIVPI